MCYNQYMFQAAFESGKFLSEDKEVCDMTMEQPSRDDILLYQGREEGIKAFMLDKVEDGVEERIMVRFML